MPNWMPAFKLRGQPKLITNGKVFATAEEALASAKARYEVWHAPVYYGVVNTDNPVNYRWKNNRNIPIKLRKEACLITESV